MTLYQNYLQGLLSDRDIKELKTADLKQFLICFTPQEVIDLYHNFTGDLWHLGEQYINGSLIVHLHQKYKQHLDTALSDDYLKHCEELFDNSYEILIVFEVTKMLLEREF